VNYFLITRPVKGILVNQLSQWGQVLQYPAICFTPVLFSAELTQGIVQGAGCQKNLWLLITSPQAAHRFVQWVQENQESLGCAPLSQQKEPASALTLLGAKLHIATIGPGTTSVLTAACIPIALQSDAPYTAVSLCQKLQKYWHNTSTPISTIQVLHVTSDIALPLCRDQLSQIGVPYQAIVAYKTQAHQEQLQACKRHLESLFGLGVTDVNVAIGAEAAEDGNYTNDNHLYMLFFSPSAVHAFFAMVRPGELCGVTLHYVAIGQTTAKALAVQGVHKVITPQKSTEGALLQALQNAIKKPFHTE
jgi:uroporphyrinogen-III synthase